MNKTYTVTLTSAEDLALSSCAVSQEEWVNNVIHERCRIAIEEIVAPALNKCFENNIQVPGSKEAIVELAFQQGWTKSLADRIAEEANSQDTP